MNQFDTYRQFVEAASPFPTYQNAPKMPRAAELSAKAAHQSDKAHSFSSPDSRQHAISHSDAANAHADAALAHEHSASKSDGSKKEYHQHMAALHDTLKQHHYNNITKIG